ncbi:MAG: 2,3-bisphosphoglycerate-dependent phosphoglycerate mutase [Candidatus Parvarchaeota archaeon]|nr:2,3-bisphosphoglycerate-dependent phosphoglycerate mutase [Candidatus Parvarchaeota archaeon]MCW1294426.1 2,3-bisphosphoglycerate-dependent phosphoglycerate mutase [Candidatus Parvarchaeum tengchongense]MCW1295752.1 2,3-bisphosphoglycerate-dependent phosphoglycerate mutase [Candidatus Parvarchaeum tengchongense]MCW1299581.1 2,3-bisphosphoglycerate-dependent phosphoglycerate mutase [Candidatus Parvarchaeum tengchongense]MCW1311815.1 2,3-bisphosphoglycerate-dependent phosphoglycerate mutase [C
MAQLCLLRHGESLWNKENRFTGWVDVPLTDFGREQAEKAGQSIKKEGIQFQVAYTSVLDRAIETLEIVMKEIQQKIPVIKDSALNERMYGDLQGLNKADTAKKYGEEQVHIWRRSYDIKPPNGESLEDTQKRTIPFFLNCIMTDIKEGKNVLVSAHGNSLRSIVMYLDNLSKEQVLSLELPTGLPIIYTFTSDGKVIEKKELLDN